MFSGQRSPARGRAAHRWSAALSGTPSGRLLLFGLLFDLPAIVAGGFDRDTTRLHRLRHFPNQSDLEHTVLEGGVLHLDIVRLVEYAAERPHRDSLVQVVVNTLVGLAALNRERRLL